MERVGERARSMGEPVESSKAVVLEVDGEAPPPVIQAEWVMMRTGGGRESEWEVQGDSRMPQPLGEGGSTCWGEGGLGTAGVPLCLECAAG